jgi:hypothetical protein
MNEGTFLSTQYDETDERAHKKNNGTERRAERKSLDLEWIESEWFEVWLRLAREGQEKSRNQ